MEKFALLDFLKVFQSLAAKTGDAQAVDNKQEKEYAAPPPLQANPAPQPQFYQRNVMADVIAHHEEVANRIRNKK